MFSKINYAMNEDQTIVIGNSGDAKPAPSADGWFFIEIDTCKMYRSESGLWVPKVNPNLIWINSRVAAIETQLGITPPPPPA